MKLYQKLKENDLVADYKDFRELVWLRAIKVDGNIIDNPNYELKGREEDITVGILSMD